MVIGWWRRETQAVRKNERVKWKSGRKGKKEKVPHSWTEGQRLKEGGLCGPIRVQIADAAERRRWQDGYLHPLLIWRPYLWLQHCSPLPQDRGLYKDTAAERRRQTSRFKQMLSLHSKSVKREQTVSILFSSTHLSGCENLVICWMSFFLIIMRLYWQTLGYWLGDYLLSSQTCFLRVQYLNALTVSLTFQCLIL